MTSPSPGALRAAQAIINDVSANPCTHMAAIIDRESGLAECATTIQFLMSQIETLARIAFSDAKETDRWLKRNDAMNAGKRTLAKLENSLKL